MTSFHIFIQKGSSFCLCIQCDFFTLLFTRKNLCFCIFSKKSIHFSVDNIKFLVFKRQNEWFLPSFCRVLLILLFPIPSKFESLTRNLKGKAPFEIFLLERASSQLRYFFLSPTLCTPSLFLPFSAFLIYFFSAILPILLFTSSNSRSLFIYENRTLFREFLKFCTFIWEINT